jgi:hypothetical protein
VGTTVEARDSSVHYFAEFDAVEVPAGSGYVILGASTGTELQRNEYPEGSSYYSLANLNPVNGHEQWHVDEYASVLAGMHIGDLFSRGDRFVAVNKRTGQIAWAGD